MSPMLRCQVMSPTVQRAWLQTPLQHKPFSAGEPIWMTSTSRILSLPTSLPLLQPSCLQRPHAPHVSFLPCLPFLLHPPCPITWVHLSCQDREMPPLVLRQHVTSLVPKLLKCQASVLVHRLPSQFPSPSIPPRRLNCNLSRSCWEKTIA